MALSEADKIFLANEIKELEAKLEEEKVTGSGLQDKRARLEEKDAFYKKQYNRFESIIAGYENSSGKSVRKLPSRNQSALWPKPIENFSYTLKYKPTAVILFIKSSLSLLSKS